MRLLPLFCVGLLLGAGCSPGGSASPSGGEDDTAKTSGAIYTLKNPCDLFTEEEISELVGASIEYTEHEEYEDIALTREEAEAAFNKTYSGTERPNTTAMQTEKCAWSFDSGSLHLNVFVGDEGQAAQKLRITNETVANFLGDEGQVIEQLPGSAFWFSGPPKGSKRGQNQHEIHLHDGNLQLTFQVYYGDAESTFATKDRMIEYVRTVLEKLRSS